MPTIPGAQRKGLAVHPTYTSGTYADVTGCLNAANSAGAHIIRGGGIENLTIFEPWIAGCQTRGLQMIFAPSMYNMPSTAFFDNLEAMDAEYPGVIAMVSGYNEPDFFGPGTVNNLPTDDLEGEDWAEYALRYQQTLYDEFQSRGITIPLGGACIGHVASHTATWNLAMEHPLDGLCDIADVHYYPGFVNDPSLANINAQISQQKAYNGDVTRAWVTETGYRSPLTMIPHGYDATEAQQATRLTSMLGMMFEQADAPPEVVTVYQLVDEAYNDFEYWGIYYWNFATKQIRGAFLNYAPSDYEISTTYTEEGSTIRGSIAAATDSVTYGERGLSISAKRTSGTKQFGVPGIRSDDVPTMLVVDERSTVMTLDGDD